MLSGPWLPIKHRTVTLFTNVHTIHKIYATQPFFIEIKLFYISEVALFFVAVNVY